IRANAWRELASMTLQRLLRGTVMDHVAHRLINQHHLVNTGTTTVAGLIAMIAALRPEDLVGIARLETDHLALGIGEQVLLLAMRTQQAHQSLCQHTEQTG